MLDPLPGFAWSLQSSCEEIYGSAWGRDKPNRRIELSQREAMRTSRQINLRERLRRIVEDSDTFGGRAFDVTVQSLILGSVISFSIETLPSLSATTRAVLWALEVATVSLFTIEYLLRLAVARNPWRYAASFFGLLDLLAIVPFYAARLDLRAVRIFRLFRLFRILKLTRYGLAMRRIRVAASIAREELVLFFSATLFVLYVAAVGIYYFEAETQPEHFGSVFHCLWWAVTTLTTVGYGDAYPVTVGGRIFTSVVLLLGLGIVAVPAGLISSALSKARELAGTSPGQEEIERGPMDADPS